MRPSGPSNSSAEPTSTTTAFALDGCDQARQLGTGITCADLPQEAPPAVDPRFAGTQIAGSGDWRSVGGANFIVSM